ncbi:hypothetical protein Nepgr_005188 [Nepenthes gracilis]|uniref:Uncharacterized protein n=1 Tax=Nepenthes gracilis TaxID=150966 RepID=A0AAD3S2P6_NEPGR|nr:hypothetical protein Nepgr_005188 [Nepenthes gracilis]
MHDQQFAGAARTQILAGSPQCASERVDDPQLNVAIRMLIADVGQMENLDGSQLVCIGQPGGTSEWPRTLKTTDVVDMSKDSVVVVKDIAEMSKLLGFDDRGQRLWSGHSLGSSYQDTELVEKFEDTAEMAEDVEDYYGGGNVCGQCWKGPRACQSLTAIP